MFQLLLKNNTETYFFSVSYFEMHFKVVTSETEHLYWTQLPKSNANLILLISIIYILFKIMGLRYIYIIKITRETASVTVRDNTRVSSPPLPMRHNYVGR